MEKTHKERITLQDSGMTAIMKMAEGNPGALTVCLQLLERVERIDPGNCMGGMGSILSLDSAGIYGEHIWMLYKDVCGEDLVKTCAVMRSWQLGFIDDPKAVKPEEVDGLLAKVKERLPMFGR